MFMLAVGAWLVSDVGCCCGVAVSAAIKVCVGWAGLAGMPISSFSAKGSAGRGSLICDIMSEVGFWFECGCSYASGETVSGISP